MSKKIQNGLSHCGDPDFILGCHFGFHLKYADACISFLPVLLPVNKIRKHSSSKVSSSPFSSSWYDCAYVCRQNA